MKYGKNPYSQQSRDNDREQERNHRHALQARLQRARKGTLAAFKPLPSVVKNDEGEKQEFKRKSPTPKQRKEVAAEESTQHGKDGEKPPEKWTRSNPYTQALKEREAREAARGSEEDAFEARKRAVADARRQRQDKRSVHIARTGRGQPKLANQITSLLARISKNNA